MIGVDDLVERRRGAEIRDKGIWRNAVRASRGFFVKVARLRWPSLQVVVRPGFARCTWGLPFLTILNRSEQTDAGRKRRTRHCRRRPFGPCGWSPVGVLGGGW
jgi:hypothetical protein